jgi:hypothetical protein
MVMTTKSMAGTNGMMNEDTHPAGAEDPEDKGSGKSQPMVQQGGQMPMHGGPAKMTPAKSGQ